ncbi:MAG TPA: MFS transporter [Streptosporangiaceae bacterium]|nr:MFS transporter [Streptosporangiaceae bacterium]
MRAETGKSRVSGSLVRGSGAALLTAGIIILALNMRAAITSLPPLFPELHGSLHLSGAGQSVLAAIPVLCFGLFSGLGAPLSRRFGEERVLGTALVLLAAGLLLRGAAPSVLLLPGTVIAGAAIALLNVLLPSLVKRRRPDRAGLLIGLYLMALSTGAIAASLIAVPVYQAAGGSSGAVRLTLGMWAVPALIAAAVWLPQLRFHTQPAAIEPGVAELGEAEPGIAEPGVSQPEAARRQRSMLARTPLAWQVTAFMGLQSLTYYATLSWFPTIFRDRGVSALHAGTLLAVMNLGNAVTALLIPVLAHRRPDQRMLAVVTMIVTAAGLAGAAFGPLGVSVPFVFLLGLGQGASLGLGIFYTMARAPDPVTAASLSAFAQSIGYLLATTGPLLLGLLHTATGGWNVPVWVLLGIVALQLVSGWLAGRAGTVPALVLPAAGAGRGSHGIRGVSR